MPSSIFVTLIINNKIHVSIYSIIFMYGFTATKDIQFWEGIKLRANYNGGVTLRVCWGIRIGYYSRDVSEQPWMQLHYKRTEEILDYSLNHV